MGLSWPAAQEYIPTTQGAAWPGQTGASTRAEVVRNGVGQERRESDEGRREGFQEKGLFGKTLGIGV